MARGLQNKEIAAQLVISSARSVSRQLDSRQARRGQPHRP
ncbi:MAG: hypothetical protein LC121_25085 [Anaerolineae bacterium]|nr:hypothetical protein [Anaerolineae bacterium]